MKSKIYFLSCLVLSMVNGQPALLAQACSVSAFSVKVNSISTSGSNCIVNVDLSWDQTNNSGNKFTNIHLWTAANYPNPALTYAAPPTATQLQNSLGTIVITNPAAATPGLGTVYQPAISAAIISATAVTKVNVRGSVNRFTVSGIRFSVPGACNGAITIKGDVWSSNSNSDNGVQCFVTSSIFGVNNLNVFGVILCNAQRQLVANMNTTGTSSIQATYSVYVDLPPLNTLDPTDPLIYTSGTVTVPPTGSSYASSPINIPAAYANNGLWIKAQGSGLPYFTEASVFNSCASLPVDFISFSAKRTGNEEVALNWETGSERNNKTFSIQRKGNGDATFKTIGIVNTKAQNGNSSSTLAYQYADNNSSATATQYRIVQTDIDGKQTISAIIIVQGNKSTDNKVIIYPNPSFNGESTFVFSSEGNRSVSVFDMNGRIVQTKNNIMTGNYQLKGLTKGIFIVKVTDNNSGETQMQKLVVQ